MGTQIALSSPDVNYEDAVKDAAADSRVIADLFLDTLVDAPVKDDQRLMAHPFFALAKGPRSKMIEYKDSAGKSIKIEPGPKGIATIWDKDILMYAISMAVDRMNRGLDVERTIRFNAYDLLRVTERGTGGQSYKLLFDALFRLRSTNITTNIESEKGEETQGFGWIDSFKIVTKETKRGREVMGAVEITLADWMWRGLQNYRSKVLTVDRRYFKLKKGLERRLYELARRHCGHQDNWRISLPNLAEKCGTTRDLRRFKHELNKIIEADNIPTYQIRLAFDGQNKSQVEKDFGKEVSWRWGSNERIIVTFAPKHP